MANSNLVGQLAAVGDNVSQGTTDSVKQGIGLYQQAQEVQQNKLKTENMQDQLDTAKFNKATTNLSLLARTNPAIAKRMVPKISEQLQAAGIPVDQNVLDTLASDDGYRQRFTAISGALSGLATDPNARTEALQAFGDIGAFDKGLAAFEANNKLAQQAAASETKASTAEMVAKIQAQGRVDAATVHGGVADKRIAATDLRNASSQYAKEVKPSEDAMGSANRVLDIIEKIEKGGLKSTKALRADLESATAALVANGRNPTVSGTDAVHQGTLFGSANEKLTQILGQAKDTIPKELLEQTKRDVLALRENHAAQHKQRYSSLRARVADGTHEKLDNSFNLNRVSNGIDEVDFNGDGIADSKQQAVPGQAPTAPPAGPPKAPLSSAARDSAIKTAKAAGYSASEIDDYVKSKGL